MAPNSTTVSTVVRIDDKPPTRIRRRRRSPTEREYIWSKSGQKCYICKTPLALRGNWQIEHILAFSLSPEQNDVLGNMLASCPPCNQKKLNRPLVECVNEFAWDLDSGAAMASHLNTDARRCLLDALEKKHELFDNCGAAPYLDEIEDRVRVSAANLLPGDHFEVDEREIGRGSFGVVYKAKWTKEGLDHPEEVAIKFPNEIGPSLLGREQKALEDLCHGIKHKHLVSYFGIVRHCWPETNPPCIQCGIVMEWCDYHMGMSSVLRRGNVVRLISQTADALGYMHDMGYLHRDVKFLNILIVKRDNMAWDEAIAKLADFGTAKQIFLAVDGPREYDQVFTKNVGTGHFRAPEVLDGHYYPKSDVYSLGKTMEYLRRSGKCKLLGTYPWVLERWQFMEKQCTLWDHTERFSADRLREELDAVDIRLNEDDAQNNDDGMIGAMGWPDEGPESEDGDEEEELYRDWLDSLVEPEEEDYVEAHEDEAIIGALGGFGVGQVLEPELDTVFVNVIARTRPNDPKRCGMRYHAKKGCNGSSVKISIDDAERFSHYPCEKCT